MATAGNDTIFGGSGADNLDGGDGDDLIYAGGGDDQIRGGNGDDLIYGGDGNDSIDAKDGSDIVYGGAGDDYVEGGSLGLTFYGGDGNDSVNSGSGDDRIDGGAGNDRIDTGSGFDTVVFTDGGGDDTIIDFDLGKDVIEIGSNGISTFADIQARMTDLDDDTLITLDDGSTLVVKGQEAEDLTAAHFNIVAPPVCYCPGTMILTDRGEIAVEHLRPGDLLITADHGLQPIRWIGTSHHSFAAGPHKHKPIEIKAGALGSGLPGRTLVVSPQHRMLLSGPVVHNLFGRREVLALAKGMVGLDHVRAMNGKRQIVYYSILCDRHEIIMAEGAWSETFYPGPTALQMIGPALRGELEALFPALRDDPTNGYGPQARRGLSRKETEALVENLLSRGFGRCGDDLEHHRRQVDFRRWDRDLADELRRNRHLQLAG